MSLRKSIRMKKNKIVKAYVHTAIQAHLLIGLNTSLNQCILKELH